MAVVYGLFLLMVGLVALVVGYELYHRFVLIPEKDRGCQTLRRLGIRWLSDRLSRCHAGLIVVYEGAPHAFCDRCGMPVEGPGTKDFWSQYIPAVQQAGDVRNADDIASEARDAIRIVRDDVAERQRASLPHHSPARR